jgi:hypothetical protein
MTNYKRDGIIFPANLSFCWELGLRPSAIQIMEELLMTFSNQEEWVRTYPSCRNATFSLLSSTANSITCIKSAICILLASQNQHLQINRWRRKGSFWFPKSWPKITKIPKLLLDSSSLTFEELGQLERFKLVWPIQSTPLSQTSNWKINPIHNSVSPIINGQAADIYLKDFELTTVVLLKEKYLPSPHHNKGLIKISDVIADKHPSLENSVNLIRLKLACPFIWICF